MFYRLSVAPIEIPALNKRTEDINSLVEYFFKLLTKDLTSFNLNLSPETIAIFQNYDWPGNVRQLKNVLEWLIIMHGSQKDYLIKPTDLPPEILGHDSMINKKNNVADLELSLKDARKVFEANYLKQQLIRFKGNIARTSNFVGMDRSALHRKIKELDININKFN